MDLAAHHFPCFCIDGKTIGHSIIDGRNIIDERLLSLFLRPLSVPAAGSRTVRPEGRCPLLLTGSLPARRPVSISLGCIALRPVSLWCIPPGHILTLPGLSPALAISRSIARKTLALFHFTGAIPAVPVLRHLPVLLSFFFLFLLFFLSFLFYFLCFFSVILPAGGLAPVTQAQTLELQGICIRSDQTGDLITDSIRGQDAAVLLLSQFLQHLRTGHILCYALRCPGLQHAQTAGRADCSQHGKDRGPLAEPLRRNSPPCPPGCLSSRFFQCIPLLSVHDHSLL